MEDLPQLPSAKELLIALHQKPAEERNIVAVANVLRLFQSMASSVPAYAAILNEYGIDPELISSLADIRSLPLIDKDSYIRKYPLNERCWDGDLVGRSHIFSATSGTTGKPTYFPRTKYQDEQYALLAEMYLLENFAIDKKSTLYVNCFAMGIWIGGLFTHSAVELVARAGDYPLSIISPGINLDAIVDSVESLAQNYDQIIIAGYPPFVKDLIDHGKSRDFDWRKLDLSYIFSAEVFSEEFREYMLDEVGNKNEYSGSLNHYGTVDLGTMAHETPLCVYIRKLALKDDDLRKRLFGRLDKVPTLAQYIPEMFFFEEVEGSLVCSAYGGVPLMRYELHDVGGIIEYNDLIEILEEFGVSVDDYTKATGSSWQVPFVYVFEREDMSVTLYGLNIYPESIRRALSSKSIEVQLSGRFTMSTELDEDMNQYLSIQIEMQIGIESSAQLIAKIENAVLERLISENTEFRKLHETVGERAVPRIELCKHSEGEHFSRKGKQKWVV